MAKPGHWTRCGSGPLWPVSGESRPDRLVGFGSTIEFREEELLLLRSGYVRELALASYPHIHCGGGDFPFVAGGVCGERRLS